MSVGERILRCRHRAPGLPHTDTRGKHDERDPRQPRPSDPDGIRRRHRAPRWHWPQFVDRVDLDSGLTDVSQALLWILGQAAEQEATNGCGRRGREHRPVWLALENFRNRVRDRVTRKGETAGQHLVEHAPEGPDVAPFVDPVTTRLLGAHVGGRAKIAPSRDSLSSRREPSGLAAFARPKSSTLTTPSGVILMFAGFRSR